MTPEQFTYWLQGFIEIENPKKFSEKQTQQIKDHLKLIFEKKTPERNIKLCESDITKIVQRIPRNSSSRNRVIC